MKRRNFLKYLGFTAAAATCATAIIPEVKAETKKPESKKSDEKDYRVGDICKLPNSKLVFVTTSGITFCAKGVKDRSLLITDINEMRGATRLKVASQWR